MSSADNVPELALPDRAQADAEEVSRCLEHAAQLVQDFTEHSAAPTLDALLAAAAGNPGIGAKKARELAKVAEEQASVLNDEVGRFLEIATES
jgi:hypothetical protein